MLQLANKVQVGSIGGGDPSLAIYYDFTQPTLAAAAIKGPILDFTRATTATYFDSSGLLQTASANTPRFGAHVYDGSSWLNKGYYVEEARTNLCLQSEDADTTWSKVNSLTVTVNDAVAPDGNTTADLITDSESGSVGKLRQNITILNDDNAYALSLHVNKTTSDSHYLATDIIFNTGGTSDTYRVVWQTNDGTVATTSGSPDATFSKDCGDHWRFTIVGSNNNTGNTNARLDIVPAYNTDGSPNNDVTATGGKHIWGIQFEKASTPSSYIPTTTAAVTRNADEADLSSAAVTPIYNQLAGTQLVKFFKHSHQIDVTDTILEWGGGNDMNRMRWRTTDDIDIQHLTTTGDDGSVTIHNVLSPDTNHTAVAAWQINDLQLALDGILGTQDTSVTVPITNAISDLEIGHGNNGAAAFDGYIEKFAYWNIRKPNPFLQNPVINV